MMRVLHVLDDSIGWQGHVALRQLVDRWDASQYQHFITSPPGLIHEQIKNATLIPLPRVPLAGLLTMPIIRRMVNEHHINVIHAWGLRAALSTRVPIAAHVSLVLHVSDPAMSPSQLKWLRTISRANRFAVACSSETVRRHIIEGGLPPQLSVVIRPGVDFSQISQWQKSDTRASLGLSREDLLLVAGQPMVRGGSPFEPVLATNLASYQLSTLQLFVNGVSSQSLRWPLMQAMLPRRDNLISPPEKMPIEQMISVADIYLATDRDDSDTTSIAWAMAANTSVIATATRAHAELIANKLNGLLVKPERYKSLSVALARCLVDRTSQLKAREVARGHAYECFSVRRYASQMAKLSENIAQGLQAGDGIIDAALAG